MKIAIMQPYLFPYIGYFQLINAAEKFIIYDDVSFIKQGWINRNNILLGGKPFLFTVPLKDASSYKAIRDTETADGFRWQTKLLKTIEQAYKKSPYYTPIIELIKKVISHEEKTIAAFALKSIEAVCLYLGINTEIVNTSSGYGNNHLHAQARVLDICRLENATDYLNPIGGLKLYSREDFGKENIRLGFIKTLPITYQQFSSDFVPWLSMIDVLMFNSPDEVREMLDCYEII